MSSEISDRIARWIRPELRDLKSYAVADAGGLIKLDAMENPYPWPDDFVASWQALLGKAQLNRYCDPGAQAVRDQFRAMLSLPDSIDIMLGNGSDELIQVLALALGGPGRVLMAPEPGFVMYRMIATATGSDYVGVPLNTSDFSLDGDAMLAAIERHQPAVVFLAYPNNPTGNLFDRNIVEQVIQHSSGLVVIDEAYSAFAGESFVGDLERYDNLLVLRTLSKMGFAGLRLGYMLGPYSWLEQLDKVRLPYNIGSLVQMTASHALEHMDIFENQAARIRADRSELYRSLAAMPDIEVWSSEANFLLFRCASGRAREVYDGLADQGVLIKQLDGSHPVLADCLRVTIGTPEDNRAFYDALASLI